MSFLTSDLPSTLLLIAIGVIIGAALTKILNRGPNPAELQQKLEDTQDQFDSYQKEVGSHFQKTAELVNNLTNSYQEVHQHLSVGAQSLAKHTPETLESSQFKALSDDKSPDDKLSGEKKPSDIKSETDSEQNQNTDTSSADTSNTKSKDESSDLVSESTTEAEPKKPI